MANVIYNNNFHNCFVGQSLARHYISGALFRSHWVVGSLDLIGSPSGFTRTVGEGVKDFVALPYQGIFQGPWSFFSGLTNGSSSLVKHISAGKRYLLIVLISSSLVFVMHRKCC